MKPSARIMIVLITIALIFLVFSLPAQGVDTIVNQIPSPSPTGTATAVITSAPTVLAPFTQLDPAYSLTEPLSGSIEHDGEEGFVATGESGVIAQDFTVQVRFSNPYSTTEAPWDYGVSFRVTGNTGYYVVVTSAERWYLYTFTDVDEAVVLAQGELDNLDLTENGSNTLRLVVVREKAVFSVNDVEVAVLDVSANQTVGSINVATAFFIGSELAGESTEYDDFMIWSAGLPPTMTPTAQPETGLIAELGENEGEIEIGGAQSWIYEGVAGEELTIDVIAVEPFADDGVITFDGFDTILTVRASNGTIIAAEDDVETGVNTNTHIEALELPEDGTYELEVRSWDNASGDEYTLVITSSREDEPVVVTPTITPTARP